MIVSQVVVVLSCTLGLQGEIKANVNYLLRDHCIQFRSGATSGSCFSSSFGGLCSGTPDECRDCNKVSLAQSYKIFKLHLSCLSMKVLSCDDEDQKESTTEIVKDDPNKDQCDYECQSTGGCNVRYTGPPRGGPTSGSCFPPLFGGSCSGTPPECIDCNKVLDCIESTTEADISSEAKATEEIPLNGDEVAMGQIFEKLLFYQDP